MLFSLAWLRDYIDFDDDTEALAHRLTMAGLAVEGVERPASFPDTLVAGRVLEVKQHPNADRLSVCRVDAGGGEPLRIVCGAPNVTEGMRVAVAKVGTVLPGGLTIKKSKIRGEVSMGMLCAEDELGLGDDHEGIVELPEGEPGTPLAEILPPGDTVLDIDISANRGDCTSHLGVAREIAALTGVPVREPELSGTAADPPAGLTIEVEDPAECPRYIGRVVRGVTVGPSPEWLVRRLEAVGQRSINNLVDITNFVLLESGQPLHAFDLDRIPGKKILVRRAKAGERLTTLDGTDRRLDPDVLLITDGTAPIALAGIMGGADTEVTETTVNVLLESAVFAPERVLRGTRRLRLDTEASLRFRRGVDPERTAWAAGRAAALMAELGGGTLEGGAADVVDPKLLERAAVSFRPARAEALLGEAVPESEMESRLRSFGFEVERNMGGAWTVRVPSWRLDVLEECDLIEEIARHAGYDRIGTENGNHSSVAAPLQEEERRRRRVAEVLRGFGFFEAVSRVLGDREAGHRAGLDRDAVEAAMVLVPDPPSREEEALRVSLVPAMLRMLGHNLRHGNPETRLFELGRTFERRGEDVLPRETRWIALGAVGGEFPPSRERVARSFSLLEFKGSVEGLCEAFQIDGLGWRTYTDAGLIPPGALELVRGDAALGFVWNVDPETRTAWNIKRPVFVAQVRFDALEPVSAAPLRYRAPSRYPAVKRDLALIVPEQMHQEYVRRKLASSSGTLLESLELFDYYRGKHIPEGHVGLGYTMTFRATDRTLEEDEVDGVLERVVAVLQESGIVRREA